MARTAKPAKTNPRTARGKRSRAEASGAAVQERRWQRAAVVGTWLDSLARVLEVLTRVK